MFLSKKSSSFLLSGLQKEKVLALNKEKLIDLTGKTFGKLTVLKRGENIGLQPSWICQCECGTIT